MVVGAAALIQGGYGGGIAVGGGALSEQDYINKFKTVLLFCKGANQSCTDWQNKIRTKVCTVSPYNFAPAVCQDAAFTQEQLGCPDVIPCPVG